MNTISIFAIAVYLFSRGAPSTEASIYACKRLNQFGVYDQCEPIQVLETLKDSIRAFSIVSKKVNVYMNTQIFEARAMAKGDLLEKGESLLVSSSVFTNASDEYHRSICQTQTSLRSEFHKLNCGGAQDKMVHFKKIFRMHPWAASDPLSKSYQSKK